jgi:hypothetical protein
MGSDPGHMKLFTKETIVRMRFLMSALFVLFAVPCVAAPILSVEPANTAVDVGQTFSVNVSIANAVDLYALQFDIGFDPSVLSANTVTEGPLLATGGTTFFIEGGIDNLAGTIANTADTLVGIVPGVTGSGLLATVSFKAIAAGTSPITIFNVTLLDSSFSGVAPTTVGAAATVSAGVAPEPGALVLLCAGWLALRRRVVTGSRSA